MSIGSSSENNLKTNLSGFFSKGEIIGGRYLVVETLGRGSSGTVVEARDMLLGGQKLALKMFPPHVAADETARKRIAREVLIGRRFLHPNLVKIYDLISEETLLGYSMELAEGRPLSKLVGEKWEPRQFSALICGILDGLKVLHSKDIVHRDLKPSNIIIANDGSPKIVDLGLARIESSDADGNSTFINGRIVLREFSITCTESGQVPGTPYYIAPEYITTRQCDRRGDIYALGLIAYELATGKLPFSGVTPEEVLAQKFEAEPPSVISICPELGAEVNFWIMKCINRDPVQRFQSVDELEDAVKSSSIYEAQIVSTMAVPQMLFAGGASLLGKLRTGFIINRRALIRDIIILSALLLVLFKLHLLPVGRLQGLFGSWSGEPEVELSVSPPPSSDTWRVISKKAKSKALRQAKKP